MKPHHTSSLVRLFGWFALLLGSIAWTPSAPAATATPCSATNVVITIPSVTLSANPIPGPLGTPASGSVVFTCPAGAFAGPPGGPYKATIQTMITNASGGIGGPPPLLFPTNITGISINLTTQPQAIINRGSGAPIGKGKYELIDISSGSAPATTSASVTFVAQLYVTGPVPSGGVISTQPLINSYQNFTPGFTDSANVSGGSVIVQASATSVTRSSCASTSPSVFLPTVSTTALTSAGAIAGTTPFGISITQCPAGTKLSITIQSASPTSATVMASTGTANNVGVRMLYNGATPANAVDVTGTVKQALGTVASNGSLTISYFAQYYASGQATSGSVKAAATYTLDYP